MMMMGGQRTGFDLELRLVGRMRLLRRDGVEVTPKGRKAQGLLALVGVAPELRRHRSWLQDKLWSDRPPEQGAASLRQELAGIRRALGEVSECLTTDGGWVALDPGRVRVRLDPDPADWELTGAPPEFVAGLDIADPEFEDWVRDQRAVFAERLETGPPRLAALPVPERRPPTPEVEDLQPSIAVMPLTLLGDLGEGPLVAAGLAIDVIGHLTRFRRLDAIAYASTAAVGAGLTAREIGARLGARYVTQGVLWLSRTRLRLTFEPGGGCDRARALGARLRPRLRRPLRGRTRARGRGRGGDDGRDRPPRADAGSGARPEQPRAYALWLRGLDDMLSFDQRRCDDALGHLLPGGLARPELCAGAVGHLARARLPLEVSLGRAARGGAGRAENFALRAVDADATTRAPAPRSAGSRSIGAITTGRSRPTSTRWS